MRRVGRHAERNDVVLLVVELEVGRVVAIVAVEDEEAINPDFSSFSMLVEVLDPFQASLVRCPTVFGCRDDLVLWQWAVLILRGEVMLALDDDKRRDRPASSIDTLDYCCPLAIARLLRLCPTTPFEACNNHCSRDDAHLKPSLVKVVDIRLLDAVLRDCVPYKRKLAANDLWIFTLGPLVVVFPIETRVDL